MTQPVGVPAGSFPPTRIRGPAARRLAPSEVLPLLGQRLLQETLALGGLRVVVTNMELLTVQEAGQGNRGIGDADVLAFAVGQGRAVLTFNRRHFINLHRSIGSHRGILVCTRDVNAGALAFRIDQALLDSPDLRDQLIRINRPPNS